MCALFTKPFVSAVWDIRYVTMMMMMSEEKKGRWKGKMVVFTLHCSGSRDRRERKEEGGENEDNDESLQLIIPSDKRWSLE